MAPSPSLPAAVLATQAASAEASFLRELHAVRRMAAKLEVTMKDIAAGCPGACSTSGATGYKAVGASVEALARRAAALRVQYERANKVRKFVQGNQVGMRVGWSAVTALRLAATAERAQQLGWLGRPGVDGFCAFADLHLLHPCSAAVLCAVLTAVAACCGSVRRPGVTASQTGRAAALHGGRG